MQLGCCITIWLQLCLADVKKGHKGKREELTALFLQTIQQSSVKWEEAPLTKKVKSECITRIWLLHAKQKCFNSNTESKWLLNATDTLLPRGFAYCTYAKQIRIHIYLLNLQVFSNQSDKCGHRNCWSSDRRRNTWPDYSLPGHELSLLTFDAKVFQLTTMLFILHFKRKYYYRQLRPITCFACSVDEVV